MIRPLLIILALLLAGCLSPPRPQPPICDGLDRRPANPVGAPLLTDPTSGGEGSGL